MEDILEKLGTEKNQENRTKAEDKDKLKKFETTIRRRVECEERAFHIVNKLIYGNVDPQYLLECARFITQDNYKDIVEERAISNLCGYPLCDEELKNVSKQKYHISTKSNKVYDITERKNFCSTQCLKASKAFQFQIPESAVWARDHEPPSTFTLLPHKGVKGMIGTEVIGEAPRKFLEKELESLRTLDSKKTSPYGQKNMDNEQCKNIDLPSQQTSVSLPVSEKEAYSGSNDKDLAGDFKKLSIGKTHLYHSKAFGGASQDSTTCSGGVEVCRSENEPKNREETLYQDEVKNSQNRNEIKTDAKRSLSSLERLNILLTNKKKVLSGMVDFQEVVSTSNHNVISNTETDNQSTTSLSTRKIAILDADQNVLEGIKSPSFDTHSSLSSNTESESSGPSKSPHERNQKSTTRLSPLRHICKILQPWVTENTKQYLKSTSSADILDVTKSAFSNPKIQSGYVDLCKRLDFQDHVLKDSLDELTQQETNNAESSKLQSVPDYEQLKEESEHFQLKVTEFITGKRVKDAKSFKTENTEEDNPVHLPTVDLYDQMMIRAKIVLDRLNKTVPELLVPMGLTVQNVSTYLRELIYTFRLERDNIIFRPPEWTLVALILLKMLAIKITFIDSAFKKDSTSRYINILLKGIGETDQDLYLVVETLLQ